MIIESAGIAMASQRSYRSKQKDSVSYSGWRRPVTTLPTAKDSVQSGEISTGQSVRSEKHGSIQEREGNDVFESYSFEQEKTKNRVVRMAVSERQEFQPANVIQFRTFQSIMGFMFHSSYTPGWLTALRRKYGTPAYQANPSLSGSVRTPQWSGVYREEHSYEEREETSFYTSGAVETADGRKIHFDVDLTMTRSFCERSSTEVNTGEIAFHDPLVINLDGDCAEVSDQKFLFDIDCDGTMDNISMLKGSGFLALDRNEDGIINNGSELFGAGSGNGFADLAVFDMDGNGWIDENDEVFNHLRIWTKDEKGKDKLVGLGVAGVGAIYLGNVSTDFLLKDSQGETQAQIRKSGVYLHEDGTVGTVQQIDMAI